MPGEPRIITQQTELDAERAKSDAACENIIRNYFDRDGISLPTASYQFGDNPYAIYEGYNLIPSERIEFIGIEEALRPGDIYKGVWVRIVTESGGVYTIQVTEEVTDANQIVVVGSVNKSGGRGLKYLVGFLDLPEVGKPLSFQEYANFDHPDQIQEVRYIDPQEIIDRIKKRVAELFEQYGNVWMSMSYTGIPLSASGTQLHKQESTAVKQILLGLE